MKIRRFSLPAISHRCGPTKPPWEWLRPRFTFKENHVFIEKQDKTSEKVVIFEKKLGGVGNLEDLPSLVFIKS